MQERRLFEIFNNVYLWNLEYVFRQTKTPIKHSTPETSIYLRKSDIFFANHFGNRQTFDGCRLCLGNDEAYYYTNALYQALSHFDQPPMVGWVIQLFSFNLYFNSEIFIRMAAVEALTINTWLLYCISKQIRCEHTGWYTANSSALQTGRNQLMRKRL